MPSVVQKLLGQDVWTSSKVLGSQLVSPPYGLFLETIARHVKHVSLRCVLTLSDVKAEDLKI